MKDNSELIMRGNEVSILKEDNEVITIEKGIGIIAMSLYIATEQYANTKSEEEKKGLEKKVNFQSKCLDSMSRALSALRR